jgi:hypothetical protein
MMQHQMHTCWVAMRGLPTVLSQPVKPAPHINAPFTALVPDTPTTASPCCMQGCANYRAMCLTDNTAVKQCRNFGGLRYITPTAAARQLSRMLCEVDTGVAACTRCDWSVSQPDCDILSVYGELCNDSGAHNECGPYHKMCKGDPELFVCRSQLPGGRPSPPGSERSVIGHGNSGTPQQWTSGAGSARSQGLMGWLLCAGAALLAAGAAL